MNKGKVAGTSPQMEKLEADKTYAWCSCGQSDNQPWCNGAHNGTEFSPMIFKVEEEKDAAICMCKQTANPPYCDGSHAKI